jgi:hypothetical protein
MGDVGQAKTAMTAKIVQLEAAHCSITSGKVSRCLIRGMHDQGCTFAIGLLMFMNWQLHRFSLAETIL